MPFVWNAWAAPPVTGTAAAVPLLREVRQDKVLPHHILVKINHKHIGDLGPSLANLTKFDPYAMANRFFQLTSFHMFMTDLDLAVIVWKLPL